MTRVYCTVIFDDGPSSQRALHRQRSRVKPTGVDVLDWLEAHRDVLCPSHLFNLQRTRRAGAEADLGQRLWLTNVR